MVVPTVARTPRATGDAVASRRRRRPGSDRGRDGAHLRSTARRSLQRRLDTTAGERRRATGGRAGGAGGGARQRRHLDGRVAGRTRPLQSDWRSARASAQPKRSASLDAVLSQPGDSAGRHGRSSTSPSAARSSLRSSSASWSAQRAHGPTVDDDRRAARSRPGIRRRVAGVMRELRVDRDAAVASDGSRLASDQLADPHARARPPHGHRHSMSRRPWGRGNSQLTRAGRRGRSAVLPSRDGGSHWSTGCWSARRLHTVEVGAGALQQVELAVSLGDVESASPPAARSTWSRSWAHRPRPRHASHRTVTIAMPHFATVPRLHSVRELH